LMPTLPAPLTSRPRRRANQITGIEIPNIIIFQLRF
jgi:hypothetical protein